MSEYAFIEAESRMFPSPNYAGCWKCRRAATTSGSEASPVLGHAATRRRFRRYARSSSTSARPTAARASIWSLSGLVSR